MYLQDYAVNFSMSGDVSFLGLWYESKIMFLCVGMYARFYTHTHTHTQSGIIM